MDFLGKTAGDPKSGRLAQAAGHHETGNEAHGSPSEGTAQGSTHQTSD